MIVDCCAVDPTLSTGCLRRALAENRRGGGKQLANLSPALSFSFSAAGAKLRNTVPEFIKALKDSLCHLFCLDDAGKRRSLFSSLANVTSCRPSVECTRCLLESSTVPSEYHERAIY